MTVREFISAQQDYGQYREVTGKVIEILDRDAWPKDNATVWKSVSQGSRLYTGNRDVQPFTRLIVEPTDEGAEIIPLVNITRVELHDEELKQYRTLVESLGYQVNKWNDKSHRYLGRFGCRFSDTPGVVSRMADPGIRDRLLGEACRRANGGIWATQTGFTYSFEPDGMDTRRLTRHATVLFASRVQAAIAMRERAYELGGIRIDKP